MTTWEQIDFLPPRYREQHAQRKNFVWRVLVLGAYVGLLVLGSVVQRARLAEANRELADAKQQVANAQLLSHELIHWQQRLEQQRAAAELITYLEHPWPRTQLIKAILPQLPATIHLNELQVQTSSESSGQPSWQPPTAGGAEKKSPAHPAAMDLQQLRRERDAAATFVQLKGLAQDQAALHAFLHELSDDPFFAAVDLISAESLRGSGPLSGFEFQARIRLKAGYGQPGGPQAPLYPSPDSTAQTTWPADPPSASAHDLGATGSASARGP